MSETSPRPKVGIILANIGTPDGTDYFSMRRYLAEFLSDKRIIEMSKLLWYPILYGIVLLRRPQRSGALYKRIWNKELDESPLRTVTRSQAKQLSIALQEQYDNVTVTWAMRYGQPSMEVAVDELMAQGCERLVCFAMYPQYSATTIGSVDDKFFEALMKRRHVPTVRTVPSYPSCTVYIEALANSIEDHLKTLSYKPDIIIASYHGIPQSYSDQGDPYYKECQLTSKLLRQRLSLSEDQLISTFQSRVGPSEWLKPYTDDAIIELAKKRVESLVVLTPGFVADCLETSDEIGTEAKELFLENGGKNFSFVPCLNDTDRGIKVLEIAVKRELQGWV